MGEKNIYCTKRVLRMLQHPGILASPYTLTYGRATSRYSARRLILTYIPSASWRHTTGYSLRRLQCGTRTVPESSEAMMYGTRGLTSFLAWKTPFSTCTQVVIMHPNIRSDVARNISTVSLSRCSRQIEGEDEFKL